MGCRPRLRVCLCWAAHIRFDFNPFEIIPIDGQQNTDLPASSWQQVSGPSFCPI
jgi:hypothetical protein